MDDPQIIALLQARDERGLDACRSSHGAYLNALALRILGDRSDAEECVSDTYFQAWRRIPPDTPRHFRAYLAAICRHFAFDRLDRRQAQKRSAELLALTEELSAALPDRAAEGALTALELGQALDRFLRTLPKQQRQLFLRRYWYADSVKELAARFGMGESRVKTSLFRTREKLRSYLESEGYDI